MQQIRVDFSKRDEKDRLDIPAGFDPSHRDRVLIYDDDMQVEAYVAQNRAGKKFLQINWHTVKYSSWKSNPPEEVQKAIEEFPMSARREWESSY